MNPPADQDGGHTDEFIDEEAQQLHARRRKDSSEDGVGGEEQVDSNDTLPEKLRSVSWSEDTQHAEAGAKKASPQLAADGNIFSSSSLSEESEQIDAQNRQSMQIQGQRTTNLKRSIVATAISADEGESHKRSSAAAAMTESATKRGTYRADRASAKMRSVNDRAKQIRKSDLVNSAIVAFPPQVGLNLNSKGGGGTFNEVSLEPSTKIKNEHTSGMQEGRLDLNTGESDNRVEERGDRGIPGAFAVSRRAPERSLPPRNNPFPPLNSGISAGGPSSTATSEVGETEMQVEAFAVDADEETRDISRQALSKAEFEQLQNAVRSELLAQAVQADVVQEDKLKSNAFAGTCSFERGRKRLVCISLVVLAVVGTAVGLSVGLSGRRSGASEFSSTNSTESIERPSTFNALMERGVLRCGVADYNLRGFSVLDQEGGPVGFYVDLCRAVAAAAFGNPNLIELVLTTDVNRFVSLAADGEAPDLLIRGDTHNFERDIYELDAGVGFTFSTPYLYDGLGFAGVPQYVSCAEKLTIAGSCVDLRVCVTLSSSWDDVVSSLLPGSSIVRTDTIDQYFEKLTSGECNVVAGETAYILEESALIHGYEGDYAFGGQLFSKEPLAIVTRQDDAKWSDFVDWVLQALLAAEEKNITKSTAELFPTTTVFGDEHQDMFRNAIAAVGNYGELYTRHLQPFLPRKEINMLNTGETGLIYSNPFGRLSNDGPGPVEGGILERILSRGYLLCGLSSKISTGQNQDSASKEWTGLDADYCRAVGAAIFEGAPDSVLFVEVGNVDDGFEVLEKGEIDVLSGAGIILERDIKRGSGHMFSFSQPYYYDPAESQDGNGETHALVTLQEDAQWSGFVYWVVAATFFAEEMEFTQDMPNAMPEVNLFGPMFARMFRDVHSILGNYAEMYERSFQTAMLPPRSGRNLQNVNPFGPQFHALPFDFV